MMVNRPSGTWGQKGDLGSMLAKALETRERKEQEYKDQYVKSWAVVFVNVADSAKPLYKLGEKEVALTLGHFRTIVSTIFNKHGACYVSPGEGALVVGCFEDRTAGINASIDTQRAMAAWNKAREGETPLVPAIGINDGEVEFRDGVLEQSNTCNLAKRIETEASPGQIFLSYDMAMFADQEGKYPVEFVKSAMVKNIPEPQDVFELHWSDVGALPARPASAAAPAATEEKKDEKLVIKARLRIGQQRKRAAEDFPVKEVIEDQVILVIDVCESSKKFWKLGDREANQLIRDYRNVAEPISRKYRCTHYENVEGDMIIILFGTEFPHKSLDAAIEIQQILLKRNISMPENKRVRAAIGLHLGEVKRMGKEIAKGVSVSTAKTLQGGAGEDQILISGTLYDKLIDQTHYDLRFLMDRTFKDVAEPIPVYDCVWHRDSSSTSSLEQRKMQVALQNVVRQRMGQE